MAGGREAGRKGDRDRDRDRDIDKRERDTEPCPSHFLSKIALLIYSSQRGLNLCL